MASGGLYFFYLHHSLQSSLIIFVYWTQLLVILDTQVKYSGYSLLKRDSIHLLRVMPLMKQALYPQATMAGFQWIGSDIYSTVKILNLYIILYMYSPVSFLSIIYPFPAMHSLLVTIICGIFKDHY